MNKPLLSITALLALNANANEFHYENFPVGDTPSALAGAYTAHHGKTYSMHYNPAGIAGVDKQVSGTLNAFTSVNTRFDEVFPTPVDVGVSDPEKNNIYRYDSLDRSSNTIIPGFLGYAVQSSGVTWGAYLSTPDISYEELSDTQYFEYRGDIYIFPTDISPFTETGEVYEERGLSLDNEYTVTQGGISAAFEVTKNFSIGGTLSLIKSKKKEVYITSLYVAERSTQSDYVYNSYGTETTRIENQSLLFEPKLGFLWKAESFSFGANISQKTPLHRNFKYNANFLTSGKEVSTDYNLDPEHASDQFLTTIQLESNAKQNHPINIDFGIQKSFNWGSITFDIHHYTDVKDNVNLASSRESLIQASPVLVETTRQFEAVTNFSIATNIQLTSSTSLYLGTFTDFSNTAINYYADDDRDIAYQAHEDIDLYGVSTALNYKTDEFDITAGFIVSAGNGKAASWELVAFDGGHNSGEEEYYEVKKTAVNAFLGIQF